MPTSGGGVYTLPEAAFAPNTLATSAAVNNNFSDIADALTDRAQRTYADAAPVTRSSTVQDDASGLGSGYSPAATDELFFSITIPTGTRRIIGSAFVRADGGSAAWATGLYSVKVYSGGGTLLATADSIIILPTHINITPFAACSGGFVFSLGDGVATAGSQLRFYARNQETPNQHLIRVYSASALCIF